MKRVALTTAAFVAAVVVLTAVALPSAPIPLDTAWNDGTVAGVLHVHSNRSDGRGSMDEVAAIASSAGLKFLIFTDHGDATREPEPPTYRSGVLCLDAVEVSTTGGHYVALDMGAAPYPLGGEPRDVVDDVRRLGGFGIAAHPDSPKAGLDWADWDAPIDGLELVNLDTSWRVNLAGGWRSRLTLLRALFTYPVRARETIGAVLTASGPLETRWSALASIRPTVGIAGADAHARLDIREEAPGTTPVSLPVPGYQSSFEAMSVHVTPAAPLTGDAPADARQLIDAIRNGRVYTAIDAWATPPAFEFTARSAQASVRSGEVLAPSEQIELHVRSNAPPGYLTRVWHDRAVVMEQENTSDLTIPVAGEPGVYRVDIHAPDRPHGPPWLIGNPIYIRSAVPPGVPPARKAGSAKESLSLFDGRSTAGWSQEMDASSLALIEAVQMVDGTELRMRYGLSGGARAGQFAGVTVETPRGVADYSALAFTVRAERPMRLSVQVRAEVNGAAPERWQRSIVADTSEGERVVVFDDMRPVGTTHAPHAPGPDVRTILFVVDTTNTRTGASGRVWLNRVRLEP